MSGAALLEAIDAIYAASLEPGGWPGALRCLAELHGAAVGALVEHRLRTRSDVVHALHGSDDGWRRAFEREWAPRNIYLGAAPVRPGAVRLSQELVPVREALRTDYVNDFLLRAGTLHVMGAVLAVDAESAVLIHVLRERTQDAFGADHVGGMHVLMPHLRRALAIRERLGDVDLRHRAALDGLDALNAGVLFLDRRGTVLFANRAAERVLAKGDGLRLVGGVLRPADARQAALLARDVAAACDPAAGPGTARGALLVARPSGRRPYVVVAAPLRADVAGLRPRGPAAIVFVTDPHATAPERELMLRQLYGLTPAEARVATLLIDGHDLTTLTGPLGVTANTARTHVKRLLAKTETQNQRELLRMLIAATTAAPAAGA
jgi:DNA-binding CsgD family transcriptional regulator/PAS domain-containing protein